MSDKKRNNKLISIIVIAVIITLVATSVTIITIINQGQTELSPEFAPIEKETYAETLNDNEQSKLEQQDGGGAVSLTYSTDVSISLKTNEAALLFQNPAKSNQNMVLQIETQDMVIAQSGLIEPNYGVTKLNLLDNVELKAGVYEGKFNVLYYDADTGEKAIVNTEIPVEIIVE